MRHTTATPLSFGNLIAITHGWWFGRPTHSPCSRNVPSNSITSGFSNGSLLLCFALLAIGFWVNVAVAQELAPRAYWPLPAGTSVLVLGYQHTDGDIVTDPSLLVTGAESKMSYAQLSYQYTSSLFGRTANVQFNLPYTWGLAEQA